MAEVTIKVKITNAEAGDIAITAAEGGIGYWSQIDTYQWSRWVTPEGPNIEVDDDFVFYTICEIDEDEGGYKLQGIDITPALIARGIQLFLDGVRNTDKERAAHSYLGEWNFEPRPFADMEEIAMMDSDEADAVIQLGAFGKLVYG